MPAMMQDDGTWTSKGKAVHDMLNSDEEFESPPLSPLMDTFNEEENTNEDVPSTLFDFNGEQTGIL